MCASELQNSFFLLLLRPLIYEQESIGIEVENGKKLFLFGVASIFFIERHFCLSPNESYRWN